jgi:probable rRNA maturation factor
MHLEINNPRRLKVDIKRMEQMINRAQEKFSLSGKFQITVSFVSRSEMQRLNTLHRGIHKETDVLSFSYLEGAVRETGEVQEIGDIIICSGVAKDQAKIHKHAFDEEVLFLCAHGLLHILGYADDTDEGAEEMHELSNELSA